MRCLAVCQDELVIRMLDEILLPGFEVEFIVENRPLARRLHDAGVHVIAGDPRRTDTFLKADLGPSTCVIIEDNGRRSPKQDSRGGARRRRHARLRARRRRGGDRRGAPRSSAPSSPTSPISSMSELFGGPLLTEFGRSLTRARVQQYQRYFSDADRVLIMLHNDPDPDAMASGLALRNVLRRTKTTAIIGAIQGVTRPENLRMVNLLDIHVETDHAESLKEFDRIAMVDVQPHYFGGLIDRVDLVIDHHPEQPGYTAVFKDIRADYGSTSTILTEHLRAVDVNISERTATAMLYAIKSDTLFFNRQTNRVDIEAFSYLYPLADAALIRKMEGAEITLERLDYVMKAHQGGHARRSGVLRRSSAPSPREDFIPYVADFFLQLEDVKWTIIAGIVNDSLVVSVRNLGYTKNAGEFVRRFFADIGSAGGHRAMAKAVVPMRAFREKFGDLAGDDIGAQAAGAGRRSSCTSTSRGSREEDKSRPDEAEQELGRSEL